MEEIISIIENCDEFNDFVYEKLVSKYGKKNVDETIFKLLSDEDINSKVFKKLVKHGDNKCTLVINRDYTIVLSNIVKQLNSLFVSVGFDESLLTKEMHYKMAMFNKDFISKNSVSREIIEQINNLYKRFIQIRNKIVDADIESINNFNKRITKLDDPEGIYQETIIAFMKACEDYNPSRGKFLSFVYSQMRNTLWDHVYDSEKILYLSCDFYDLYVTFVNFVRSHYEKYGCYPSRAEIAFDTGLPLTKIDKLQEVYNWNNRDISIGSMVLVDGEYMPLIDSFYDNRNFDSIEDGIIKKEMMTSLIEIINELPEKDRKVIFWHYFCDCSLSSISCEMNYTYAYICAIHSKALGKIKERLK